MHMYSSHEGSDHGPASLQTVVTRWGALEMFGSPFWEMSLVGWSLVPGPRCRMEPLSPSRWMRLRTGEGELVPL